METGRKFQCMEHSKEYALVFASNWGFHLNVQTNFHLACARVDQKKNLIPSEKRHRRINIVKVGCGFIIRSSPVMPFPLPPQCDDWKRTRFNCQVKITSCNFEHCAKCSPGPDSQLLACKNSGYYVCHKIKVPGSSSSSTKKRKHGAASAAN